MCAGVAEQIEILTSVSQRQDRLGDLLPLLESIFTRLSESSSAQGKRMRPEHLMRVKKALSVAVRGITEGGVETLFLTVERRKSITAFCEKVALARSNDKVLEISLQLYVFVFVGLYLLTRQCTELVFLSFIRSHEALKAFLAGVLSQ